MAKGVFVHRADSIYDDFPEERYQFPKRYLNRVKACEGDWIVYYEPRGGGGRLGYNAIAKIHDVVPDLSKPDMFLALIEPGTYLPLERFVPYFDQSGFIESAMQKPDGTLNKGLVQWAVRPISEYDFNRILEKGFIADDELLPRSNDAAAEEIGFEVSENAEPFDFDDDRIRVDQTISRLVRSRVFRRIVLEAYDSRCALTGLKLLNGKGRAEVEAAHIKPVAVHGPDTIRNGIALSGTVHWMFDRGLISLSDGMDILVSRQVNDPDQIWSIVRSSRRAWVPKNPVHQPHPRYLSWHRESCFKY